MPEVHVLDKELAELIAAGEVIERPSSVIKELTENSIDSGATAVTVEIKHGGISYIRITDNGCGMSFEDVPVAFLRHATSKLSVKDDLNRIMTLGFRGEALASVCAVAKCEVLTRREGDEYGTHYVINGTEEQLYEKSGCGKGTTIIVRDIFYNVPARLKFLKKDKYEGNAIASIVSKIAVSHPDISFRFIRDNKQELFTPGDSRLYSAVYSVFGKEFAAAMIPVDYSLGGVHIYGYTVKPLWGRKNRTMQFFFINGRYVKTLTGMSALEEAYRNNIMEGKFPACVLFMDVAPNTLDVNVHPAKTEVRFSDEKLIYEAVYFAVKNAIMLDEKPAEINLPQHVRTAADYAVPMFSDPPKSDQTVMPDTSESRFAGSVRPVQVISRDMTARREDILSVKNGEEYRHDTRIEDIPREFVGKKPVNAAEQLADNEVYGTAQSLECGTAQISPASPEVKTEDNKPADISHHIQSGYGGENESGTIESLVPDEEKKEFKYIDTRSFESRNSEPVPEENKREEIYFRIIGEAFKNYAIAETEDGILIIDKHAAHERIRFERLRTGREDLTAQLLLAPEELILDYGEYDALVRNLRVCADCGFEIEPLDAPRVLIKGIPSMLDKNDASDIVAELAQNFAAHRHDPLPEILDDMYHTMACRGAIKANDITGTDELKSLVGQILSDERIRYCPHGRPVMFKLTKRELEKQFRRIV